MARIRLRALWKWRYWHVYTLGILGVVAVLMALTPLGKAVRWDGRARLPLILSVVVLLGVMALSVFNLPSWLIARRLQGASGEPLTTADRIKAENDLRAALLQAFGGIALLAGIYFTWFQLRQGQDQFKQGQDQFNKNVDLTRRGQLADRFNRAMDQIGDNRVDVRLGGVYALERLMQDSPADHATIVEILTAYVRRHAPWSAQHARSGGDTAGIPDLGIRSADIQAVMSILARMKSDPADIKRLNLSATDLRRLTFSCQSPGDPACPHLHGANFSRSSLDDADLFSADLEQAVFQSASLERARLGNAQLRGANFLGADLVGADLSGADLHGAFLQGAKLTGAQFDQAHLEGAELAGTDLTGVRNLGTAVLQGATADQGTKWPKGFNWRKAGVQLL